VSPWVYEDSPVYPQELVKALARNDVVIVLGAGVTMSSVSVDGKRPPSWDALLRIILNACDLRFQPEATLLLDQKRYLDAAELLWRHVGSAEFKRILVEQFFDVRYLPGDLHREIKDLEQNLYLTPNYDKTFDIYMQSELGVGVAMKNPGDEDLLEFTRTGRVFILKFHGTIDNLNSIVLTRKQYAEARLKYASTYRIIDALLMTKTFLFVGCGLQDPDMELLLENVSLSFPEAPRHYFIKQFNDDSKHWEESIGDMRNLKFLYYKGDHLIVPQILRDLNSEVATLRSSGLAP
jgi:hypothetical protein